MLLLQAPRSNTSWPGKNRHLPSVLPSWRSVSQHRRGSVNPLLRGRLSPLFHPRGLVERPPRDILNLCPFPSLGSNPPDRSSPCPRVAPLPEHPHTRKPQVGIHTRFLNAPSHACIPVVAPGLKRRPLVGMTTRLHPSWRGEGLQ